MPQDISKIGNAAINPQYGISYPGKIASGNPIPYAPNIPNSWGYPATMQYPPFGNPIPSTLTNFPPGQPFFGNPMPNGNLFTGNSK